MIHFGNRTVSSRNCYTPQKKKIPNRRGGGFRSLRYFDSEERETEVSKQVRKER